MKKIYLKPIIETIYAKTDVLTASDENYGDFSDWQDQEIKI